MSSETRARCRGRAAVLWLLVASGCASSPCVRRERIAVRLSPHKQLNQDRDGYARSVVVRLYQIDSVERFREIGFDALWHTPDTGTPQKPIVVAPEQLTVVPGKSEERTLERAPGAAYLAVVANFRERQAGDGWQVITALPGPIDACKARAKREPARWSVELADYGIRLRTADARGESR